MAAKSEARSAGLAVEVQAESAAIGLCCVNFFARIRAQTGPCAELSASEGRFVDDRAQKSKPEHLRRPYEAASYFHKDGCATLQ